MSSNLYNVQKKTLFSKSLIWQINKDFYHQNGIGAWSNEKVPHMITNSSMAATTYAELIYALLKDLSENKKTDQVVYILELGAGHGRLCFNIIQHLDKLIADDEACTTKYCYVLSDIVEDNLSFYREHKKFKNYFDRGVLDYSFFDATVSQELVLRYADKTISLGELDQPILTIANYFFDSIPNELYYVQDKKVYECSVSIESTENPKGKNAEDLLDQMSLSYHKTLLEKPIFENKFFNEILNQYDQAEGESYILFPKVALQCLANISALSKTGLVLLTMDKGYKEIHELLKQALPDLIKHGSFSLWVNFHALSQYCIKNGGISMLDASTNFDIELACLFFTKPEFQYRHFEQMYRKHSSLLNLDDFNSIKKHIYKNLSNADLSELLGLIRLSSYDSSIFIKLLPSIKKLSKEISMKQRTRLRQTIDQIWLRYYAIKNDYDLSYELGGLMYDLGYYQGALVYFDSSSDTFGDKVDVFHSTILCYYQLRQDDLFYKTLTEAKLKFPQTEALMNLEKLDMS